MTSEEEKDRQDQLALAHFSYEKGLKVHAFFKLHNREISEDLVQDTFMKTWAYLAKGGKIDVMKSFLNHILNNLIVDEYRKRKTGSLDTLVEQGLEPGDEKAGRLFDILDGKTALALIDRLPPTYQKVMRMRYVEDLTVNEMSAATGRSRNSISVQVHRGLEKLKLLYRPSKRRAF
jgi:RNA polymerase sigma-70 factor, ECF subfamily